VVDDETRDGLETLGVALVTLDDVSKVVGSGMLAFRCEREVELGTQGFGSSTTRGIVMRGMGIFVRHEIDGSDDLATRFTDEVSCIVSDITTALRIRNPENLESNFHIAIVSLATNSP